MKVFIIIFLLLLYIPISFADSQCDYKVEVLLNSSEFHSNEFKWRMKSSKIDGMPTNITGTAKIEDLNGNIIKKYAMWNNETISKQKTSSEYSPNLKEGNYKIISEIVVGCDDTNGNNNIDVKIIKIKPDIKTDTNQIASAPPVPLDSKNESKNQNPEISAVSEPSIQNSSSVQNKNQTNMSAKEDTEDKESDNFIYLTQKNTQGNSVKLPAAQAVSQDLVYKSSSEKANSLIVFFLLGISILINVVLIWRR